MWLETLGEHPISSWVRGNWIREEAPDFLAPFPQPPASAPAGDQALAEVVSPAAVSKAVGLNSVCPSLVEALVNFCADRSPSTQVVLSTVRHVPWAVGITSCTKQHRVHVQNMVSSVMCTPMERGSVERAWLTSLRQGLGGGGVEGVLPRGDWSRQVPGETRGRSPAEDEGVFTGDAGEQPGRASGRADEDTHHIPAPRAL